MPLYPFTCTDCGTEFESFVTRPTAEPQADCPSCGSRRVTRDFGLPARPVATPETNCRGDGPPCGAPLCGRNRKTQF